MKCNICGRQSQNEEANFCEYCGSSFREHVHTMVNSVPREQINGEAGPYLESIAMRMPGRVAGQSATEVTETYKPITFLNWLGTYGILFIPFIGWLIFFVMLFVWGFGSTTPASKKNWARVNLIFVVVLIVIFIGYLIMILGSPMFQEMMSGTFDYNSYYDGLYNLN